MVPGAEAMLELVTDFAVKLVVESVIKMMIKLIANLMIEYDTGDQFSNETGDWVNEASDEDPGNTGSWLHTLKLFIKWVISRGLG